MRSRARPSKHGVGVGGKDGWVDDEARSLHHQRDTVVTWGEGGLAGFLGVGALMGHLYSKEQGISAQ